MHTISRSLAIILWATFPLLAQATPDAENDPFNTDDFDSAIEMGNTVDSISKLTYLSGVTLITELNGKRLSETGSTGSDFRLYGKAFAKASKADIGALYLSVNFNYFLFAAADDNPLRHYYQLQSPNGNALTATLSEFHFSFDLKKKVFVRIGNQLISWGATYFWSPEDFVNRQKSQATVLSVVDNRSGKPGVRIHVPLKTLNLFLFTDFSGINSGNSINSFSETVAQAWRIDGTLGGVQIGCVGYHAKSKPLQIGFDATGNTFGADIYGELALTFSNDEKSAPQYQMSIGASRSLGEEQNFTARGEFYYNDQGFSDTTLTRLAPGSFTPLYSGRYYAYGELSAAKLVTSILSGSLFGYANLADRSYSTTLLLNVAVPGVLPFSLYGTYYGGYKEREFTSLWGDQMLVGGFRIRGDF